MKLQITEAQFQRQVTDLAEQLGWAWMHIERMGNTRGQWRTPTTGPLGKGWPDLVLIKGQRLLFAELKRDRISQLTEPQRLFYSMLLDVNAVEAYVWRPDDWNLIVQVLSA